MTPRCPRWVRDAERHHSRVRAEHSLPLWRTAGCWPRHAQVTTPPLGPLSTQSIDRVPKHQLIALQHACCPHYALRLHTLVQPRLDHRQRLRADVGRCSRKLGEEAYVILLPAIVLAQG